MKHTFKIVLVLGVACCAAEVSADDAKDSTDRWPMELTPRQFVQDAMVGGMKEVRLGEIALGQIQNADVKRFAEHMVNDHSKANESLMKIASGEGLDVPATNMFSTDDPNWSYPLILNPAGLKGGQLLTLTNLPYLADYQSIQRLQSLSADQFDQSYVAEMVADHTKAIKEFYAAAQNMSDKKLNKFADTTLPTLRKHYDMAKKLAEKLGVNMNTNSAGLNSAVQTNGLGLQMNGLGL